jgi:hypothetical protein
MQDQKIRYKNQLSRLKQGLSPVSNVFNADAMHDSIREILGEELANKFINEVYDEIGAKHARKRPT